MIWISYCILEGIFHGWFYKNRKQEQFNFNEHLIWVGMRLAVTVPLLVIYFQPSFPFDAFWWYWVVFVFASQPFLHNGSYYTTRYLLGHKPYRLMFFAQSTTSTSKWTQAMTPGVRVFLFIFAMTFYIIGRRYL